MGLYFLHKLQSRKGPFDNRLTFARRIDVFRTAIVTFSRLTRAIFNDHRESIVLTRNDVRATKRKRCNCDMIIIDDTTGCRKISRLIHTGYKTKKKPRFTTPSVDKVAFFFFIFFLFFFFFFAFFVFFFRTYE